MSTTLAKRRVVVLISGRGSNLGALISASKADSAHYQVCAAISDSATAGGLEIAQNAGIGSQALVPKEKQSRANYGRELLSIVRACKPDLVVLAGFMRILSTEFVESFTGRIINIHPSLLPLYPGLNTHQRVLDAGDAWHGASIHFVTPELDAGPVIAQARINVLTSDNAGILAARLLVKEHELLPYCVELFCQDQVQLVADKVRFKAKILDRPVQLPEPTTDS